MHRELGRSPTSSNAAALIFRVSVLIFEAKSHLHFVLAFTQQPGKTGRRGESIKNSSYGCFCMQCLPKMAGRTEFRTIL